MNMRRWTILLVALGAAMGLQACASAFHRAPRLRAAAAAPAPVATRGAGDMTPQVQASLYLDVIDGLVKQARYGAALAYLNDFAVKKNSLTPRYWLLRGDALLGTGRGNEAWAAYARLDATPQAAQGWNGRGRIMAGRKQWRGAAQNFQQAVAADPSNADFLNNLAFAQMHDGQMRQSAGYLRQAHELNPGSELIRNNLIIALTLAGDKKDADRLLAAIPADVERQKAAAVVRSAIQANAFTMEGKS